MGVGLVVTDANHVDSMMVEDYSLDCAWGKDENDFELTVDKLIPQRVRLFGGVRVRRDS